MPLNIASPMMEVYPNGLLELLPNPKANDDIDTTVSTINQFNDNRRQLQSC